MKKIIFSLILLFSFEANANIQSYWSFSEAWISKLQKECEPIFLEEYTEFPKEYYQLNGKDKVFFCALMLERAGVDMSESDDWFKQAKMQNIWEMDYEANVGQLPAKYYLIPRRGEARQLWIIERLKEHQKNSKTP